MINADMIFGLTMDWAVPNSTWKDFRIAGGILAVTGATLAAPIWVPAAGRLILGAPAVWDKFKQWVRGAPPPPPPPNQLHHFMPKGESKWTWKFQRILDKYGLNVHMDFNTAMMPHQGRHCFKYYEWLLGQVQRIDATAGGNVTVFLREFEAIKRYVIANPDILYNRGW